MLIIKNFFYFLSATDKEVIAEFPSESNKRISIGMMIFCNALLIAFAMSFSLYYITESYIIGIGLGILALIISILLNRFFVIIPKNSLFPKLFFVFLSLIFAVIISVPLEIRLFENEIDKRIIENRIMNSALALEALRNNTTSEEDKEILLNRNRLEELYRREDSIQKAYIEEISGAGGSGKIGVGKIASLIKEQLEETRKQINDQNYKLNDLIQRRDVLVNPVNALHEISVKDNSFLSRVQALYDIRATNQLVNITSFMVILLIVGLELTPFFTIMFLPKTEYQETLEMSKTARSDNSEENELINSRIKLPTFSDGFFSAFDMFGDSAPSVNELKGNHDTGVEADIEAIKNDWKFVNKDWRNVSRRYGTRES